MQGEFAIVEISKALRIPESLYSPLNSDETCGASKDHSRSAATTLGVDLPHDPLCPLNGSCHQRFRSRTRLGIKQVFCCFQVACNKNSSDDSDDSLAAFLHARMLAASPFVRHPLRIYTENLRLRSKEDEDPRTADAGVTRCR